MNEKAADRLNPVKLAAPAPPVGRRWLMPLLCAALLGVALWVSGTLAEEHHQWPGQSLSVAEYWLPDAGSEEQRPPVAADWQPVTLPDNWKVSRPFYQGSVWYRLRFDRGSAQTQALLLSRLATSGSLLLNGSQLWERRAERPGITFSWNAPLLVVLPSDLLRAAGNEVLVQVSGSGQYRAGLAAPQLADYAALRPVFKRRNFWQFEGAMLSGTVSLVAGLMMLLTWLRQRQDRLFLFFFGLASLAWAARNSNLFLEQLPLSLEAWTSLVVAGNCWFYALFGLFVLRFAELRWPRVEASLWAYAGLNSILLLLGVFSNFQQLMAVTIAPGLLFFFVLVGLLARKAWHEGSVDTALMTATALVFLLLSYRDLLLLRNQLPYDAYSISHYTGVLMLVSTLWGLVARVVTARVEVVRLNASLGQRVADREQQLQQAFDGLREQRHQQSVQDERQRMMREIHDGVGAQLVGLLNMVARPGAEPAVLHEQVQHALDEMRMAVDSLQPVHDDLLTVLATLRYRLQARLESAGIRVIWQVDDLPALPNLSPQKVLQVQRILLEAFTNILKHARATEVTVSAEYRVGEPAMILLRIADNGVGMSIDLNDQPSSQQADSPVRRHGIGNMQARAAALGAQLRLESSQSGGLSVALDWPVDARAPDKTP
ncbi:sensor histidine kinase [Roseateles oligotrophus]|uniref:histidine kinase n=1 Tax=Roseateles oligotrophus TaxID=1769250 RepID=A0ABT2YD03_9BURK|nr:ATP-binding protein [Roseateles oligotrophus]MCV2367928.1 hypothetical protein [Roseateles oligotrophus]